MKVIGIDPGYERLGVSVVEKNNDKEKLLYSNCIKTPKNSDFNHRLEIISRNITELIEEFSPENLAIESLFFNKNQKTVMRVSEVKGAIINIALTNKLKVYEFTPLQIKVAVTGYGRSDKRQVISMVKNLIEIEKDIKTDDEFDAIAVAITFFASQKVYDQKK